MTTPATHVFRGLCVLVAVLPIVATSVLACEPPPPSPAPPTTLANAPTPTTSTTASTTASTSESSLAAASTMAETPSVVASAPAPEPPPPNLKVSYLGTCGAAAAFAKFLDAHRACNADGDCAVEQTMGGLPGACGIGVQKSAVPEVAKRTKSAFDACVKAGVPMPIPSCPKAKEPRCAASICQP